MLFTVLTTIAPPTACVRELSEFHTKYNLGQLIIVGDQKGPSSYELENCRLLSLEDQSVIFPELSALLPKNHYARKNLGYLLAVKEGADCVYETDDDNRPNQFWKPRSLKVKNPEVVNTAGGWVNVYRYFTDDHIWPRGLPLNLVSQELAPLKSFIGEIEAPIQQGLVDNSPDVDAVWRLVLDRQFEFDTTLQHSVLVPKNVWCPFNTQSTWWWPVAYPLMYIPSNCSFRMCDIWKSFVAQRCLWELDCGIVYQPPEVIQDRNEHDLMKDFYDEIPGYVQNEKIADHLAGITLLGGRENVVNNLRKCYEVLVEKDIFPPQELDLVNAWCGQIETFI
jgi:hypothetical protein